MQMPKRTCHMRVPTVVYDRLCDHVVVSDSKYVAIYRGEHGIAKHCGEQILWYFKRLAPLQVEVFFLFLFSAFQRLTRDNLLEDDRGNLTPREARSLKINVGVFE